MRADVLCGTHILFSGVIPLDVPPHTAEIYKMARMFGATVANELNSQVTHVVAAKVRVLDRVAAVPELNICHRKGP
jgi:RNA polymerase II subunit A C-terminal domain phosphatase